MSRDEGLPFPITAIYPLSSASPRLRGEKGASDFHPTC